MMTLPPGMEMLAERIAVSPRCTGKYKLGVWGGACSQLPAPLLSLLCFLISS